MASRGLANEGNLKGLVAVLDPDVVWTSDGGGRARRAVVRRQRPRITQIDAIRNPEKLRRL
ncbi:MAG TPA: hypothetical protein VIJ33_10450 [Solirubrobacteraceae bacterium]